eukprot:335434_1
MLTVAVRIRPESISHNDSDSEDDNKSHDTDIPRSIEVFEEPANYVRINNEFNLYFDTVLGANSFQSDVFSSIIRDRANDLLNGKNSCILSYGARSAGKSYSMFGKLHDRNAVSHLGMLPRSISYVIEKLRSKSHLDWNLFISFGSVSGETISDLISHENTKHIHLKRNKKSNEYYLKNLTQIKIRKISSFLKHLHLAEEHRDKYHRAAEHMFAVIKLNVYRENRTKKISSTVMNFIDCAAYDASNEELNFSFIQLNALMTRCAKKNDLHIDARESVLTKLLYPIRRANSDGKLLVLICATLDRSLAAETMATLRFGNLPTIDPFILGMMEKQRHKMKKLEAKSKGYKSKYKELKQEQEEPEEDDHDHDLREIIARLEGENAALRENENKYCLLESEYELMKLDYASNKKELNTQKNHNFWLMEDYNELKLKLGRKTSDSINGDTDEDKMTQLLSEMRVLREAAAEHDLATKKYETEINELETELAERDDQISELHKELRAKEEMIATDRKMYEKSEKQQNGENDEECALVERLRAKKRKLEEKVINLRTDKAKQIVAHNQELHALQSQMNAVSRERNNLIVIRKWSKLVHERKLIAASENMQRATKKMKQNYTQNSEFRDQMFLLRKMADKKLQSIDAPHSEFEKEMIGALPTNLKRIHQVMDRLTNKLIVKNAQIDELHRKLNGTRRSSSSSTVGSIVIADNLYSPSTAEKITAAYQSNDLSAQSIDIVEEANYLNKQYSIATEANHNYNSKNNEYELKEKQLRFLKDSALSVVFHANENANNTRIKLNIAMSPCDVYEEMCPHQHKKIGSSSLIISPNQKKQPIVIPSNCMHMSFWQLCVEFGIFDLINFNFCHTRKNNYDDPNEDAEEDDDIVYSP